VNTTATVALCVIAFCDSLAIVWGIWERHQAMLKRLKTWDEALARLEQARKDALNKKEEP
jgi:DNA-binding transcriptional regulator of glucitol operon